MSHDADFGWQDLIWRLPLWFVLSLASIPVAFVLSSRLPFHVPATLFLLFLAALPFALAGFFGLLGSRMAAGGKAAVLGLSLVVLGIVLANALWLGCVVGAVLHERGWCL